MTDCYDELCKYYEFQTGPIPDRETLKEGLRQTIPEQETKLFLLIPFFGKIKLTKLARKAEKKLNVSGEALDRMLDHMYREAFIMKREEKGETFYERGFSSYMAEQQVRMRQGTPLGKIYAKFWNDLSTITITTLPTKTPYFRVVPVESTVTGKRTIPVGESIQDTREVLPIDVITEIVKNQALIAVSECYCRLSEGMLGRECSYPRETCFTFNDMAENLIDINLARRVDVPEAIDLLMKAEEAGLIHHADNCQEEMKVLCNCCPCCCPAVKAYKSGITNVGSPSRYIAVRDGVLCTSCHTCAAACPVGALSVDEDGSVIYDSDRCIGCGHCASVCPEKSIRMVLRQELPKMDRSNDELWGRIRREAMVGMVRDKIFPRKK